MLDGSKGSRRAAPMFAQANDTDAHHRAVMDFCVAARREERIRLEFAPQKRDANRVFRENRETLRTAMIEQGLKCVPLDDTQNATLKPRITGRMRMSNTDGIVDALIQSARESKASKETPQTALMLLDKVYQASGTSKTALSIVKAKGSQPEEQADTIRNLTEQVAMANANMKAVRHREQAERSMCKDEQVRLRGDVCAHMSEHDPENDVQRIMLTEGGRAQTYYLERSHIVTKPRVTLKVVKKILAEIASVNSIPDDFCAWILKPRNADRLRLQLKETLHEQASKSAETRRVSVCLKSRMPRTNK